MAEIGSVALFFVFFVAIIFSLGLFYWLKTFLKRSKPDLKWWFKYKVFRRKYNEKDVRHLLQYLDAKMSDDDVEKMLFLRTNRSQKQISELIYIYNQMKGGNKNE